MKYSKYYYTLALTLLCGMLHSQNFFLSTQSDVDAFPQNITTVNGSVFIGNSNSPDQVTNLDALSNLTSITNDLWINYTDYLVSIEGLLNLTSVGGSLGLSDNDALQSFSGLENLNSVGGSLWIQFNDELETLEALSSLTHIGGTFGMSDNDVLQNLNGLCSLESIGENLFIQYNDVLQNISSLANLSTMGGTLIIGSNPYLCNCDPIADLTLTGSVFINSNSFGCNSLQEIQNDLGCQVNDGTDNCSSEGDKYVLVATNGELEFDQCIAHVGGIGIMSNHEAEIEDYAFVIAPGTFVKAPEIDVDETSEVNVKIYEQAQPQLPLFIVNDIVTNNDIFVGEGETAYLTEGIYDDIYVDDGGTVIFGGNHHVYIDNFETEDDVSILFRQCTNLMIRGELELGPYGSFNTYQKDVTAYVSGDITVKRGNIIYGTLYTEKKFEVKKSSEKGTAQLHGLFIGQEVEANEFGEYWAQDFNPDCFRDKENSQGVSNANNNINTRSENPNGKNLDFAIYPNPARDVLNFELSGSANDIISITIHDATGNLIIQEEKEEVDAQYCKFNLEDLQGGLYIITAYSSDGISKSKKFMVTK